MDTCDEWINQRSGIKTRHWVSDGETGATLARRAALQALAKAGMKPRDLDCIVYCTCTPDHLDRKSTRLNSSHQIISYAVFCLKEKKTNNSVLSRLKSYN